MKALNLNGEFAGSGETAEDRRARHESTHNRLRMIPKQESFTTDRRLLHGAVLNTGLGETVDDVDVNDETYKGKTVATVEPADEGDEQAETAFSKKLRRSTPQSREALLKLLATSRKKGRVTFDFGFRGMWEDLIGAITFRRPMKPTSKFRTVWDAIILSLICYGLFMIPFDIAFDVTTMPWILFDIMLDIFYILDLLLNFITAYVSGDNELVTDFRMIRIHYFRTWFFIDLIASLPFGIISYAIASGSEALQVIKLLKAFRLFRMSHLYRAVAGLNNLKGPFLVALLMVFFGIAAHWFACLFWRIAVLEGIEDSWVYSQGSITKLAEQDQAAKYLVCLYWAMTTITTLGYGDITPHTFVEVLYVTFVIFCGAAMYAILISSVSMIVVGRFTAESEYNRHMDSIQAFSKLYHLPPDVTRRVTAYYDFIWERRRNFSNQTIMDDLPFELRAIVAGAVHAKMIQHNPLLVVCESFGFKHMFAAKISQIVLRLPDEVLHFEGDEVSEVFFVRRGLVDIVVGLDTVDELVVGKRHDGGHLGDIGLFDNGYYAASGVTVHFSEVCSITAKALLDLLEQFPRERALFEAVAKARAAAIERLLMEFDELAAGKQNEPETTETVSPQASKTGSEKKQTTFLNRLLGHETTDSDFEFFWKLWEHAVSPETDEMLVESTARMPSLWEDDDLENDKVKSVSMKSRESTTNEPAAHGSPSSPRPSGITATISSFNPFASLLTGGTDAATEAPPTNAAGGFAMAGTSDRENARRLKSYVSDATIHPFHRRSSVETPARSLDVVAASTSPSLRPRGESNAGSFVEMFPQPPTALRAMNGDSVAREFDAFTQIRRPEDQQNPFDSASSFQDVVLSKLELIMARLDSLEASASERRMRMRRDESIGAPAPGPSHGMGT